MGSRSSRGVAVLQLKEITTAVEATDVSGATCSVELLDDTDDAGAHRGLKRKCRARQR